MFHHQLSSLNCYKIHAQKSESCNDGNFCLILCLCIVLHFVIPNPHSIWIPYLPIFLYCPTTPNFLEAGILATWNVWSAATWQTFHITEVFITTFQNYGYPPSPKYLHAPFMLSLTPKPHTTPLSHKKPRFRFSIVVGKRSKRRGMVSINLWYRKQNGIE